MKVWLGVWVALLMSPVTAASQFYCPDFQSQRVHWVTHSAQMKSVEAAYSQWFNLQPPLAGTEGNRILECRARILAK